MVDLFGCAEPRLGHRRRVRSVGGEGATRQSTLEQINGRDLRQIELRAELDLTAALIDQTGECDPDAVGGRLVGHHLVDPFDDGVDDRFRTARNRPEVVVSDRFGEEIGLHPVDTLAMDLDTEREAGFRNVLEYLHRPAASCRLRTRRAEQSLADETIGDLADRRRAQTGTPHQIGPTTAALLAQHLQHAGNIDLIALDDFARRHRLPPKRLYSLVELSHPRSKCLGVKNRPSGAPSQEVFPIFSRAEVNRLMSAVGARSTHTSLRGSARRWRLDAGGVFET